MRYVTRMEFRHRETADGPVIDACAGELITELTLLVDRRATDPLAADLACRDLEAALVACNDALAADGSELIAQVITRTHAVSAARLPIAS